MTKPEHHKAFTGVYVRYIKRLLDVICSLLAIIIFFWLFAFVALLVRINLGSPVIFKQPRPGKIQKSTGREKIFTLYKFRTMTDEKDKGGNLLPDSERLTNFGRFLRSTSLDELPEVINILKGDMSIVGPRPLLVQYLPRYNEAQRHRHDVRPGLSGYAQVHGRNSISWDEKFEMDVWYTENISFSLDAKILLATVKSVLTRDGISSASGVTMEEFVGNS